MKNDKPSTDSNHEYSILVNKLRSYLEPLVELHRAKMTSNEFSENLLGSHILHGAEASLHSISSS